MANENDGKIAPQEAQRGGQSAISQGDPLRELNQEGAAAERKAIVQHATTLGLNEEEVAVLCDIDKDGAVRPAKQRLVESLAERGLIETPLQKSSKRFKLTSLAHRLLSERGVGLNEA